MDHREIIEEVARRKVAGFTGTIDADGEYYSQIYPGSASMGESIASDYHGRFLIELIQNANDVHPADESDGEIEVVLDLGEGPFGVLYVANRGTPFLAKNVNALCDMGLSSKPPGESIGNKGLGFRSVHHITDAPRVYSRMAEGVSDRFDGFCFRFATSDDLDALIDEPRHRELAKTDLPLFHIPIWLDEQPDGVRHFAQQGYSTLIALPLRSSDSAEDVLREFAGVRDSGVPLLLFLPRLARLALKVVGSVGVQVDDITLTRNEETVEIGPQVLTLADLGTAGTYLITRRAIEESQMLAAMGVRIRRRRSAKRRVRVGAPAPTSAALRPDAT